MSVLGYSTLYSMTQERSVPGCPWTFADDMRKLVDRKEFRLEEKLIVLLISSLFVGRCSG